MIKKLLSVATATAAAALAMVYLPGTAGAAPSAAPGTLSPVPTVTAVTSVPVHWIPAGCATGSFDPVTVYQGHYLLPATIELCVPYKAKFAYTLAVFTPGRNYAVATRGRLRPYAESGPALTTADVLLSPPEPVFAMCLLRDVNARVACARVDITAAGVATSTAIPVTDPLVAKPVIYDDEDIPVPPDPICGTCVSFP
jgi:hypothetical protein